MKKLDLSQVIKTFEGKPFREGDEKSAEMTLKRVILTYLRSANQMGINPDEEITAYETGIKIASCEKECELSSKEYDLVKKLADNAKIKQQGQEQDIFGVEIKVQVKKMVDEAEMIKENKK